MAIGKNLGDEDPDDRPLAEGVRGLKDQEASQDDQAAQPVKLAAVMVKGPGDGSQAGDVTE